MKSVGNFAKNLSRIREDQGLSLRALADKIGVSFQIISKIENLESRPTLETAIKISEGLSISLDKMLKNT